MPALMLRQRLRARSRSSPALSQGTNLSSKRRAGGETLAEPGDAGVHRALVVLERDFCVVDRAGTRTAPSETDELDETEQPRAGRGRPVPSLPPFVHFVTLGHGARRGRVPADAEVGQRDGSPDARCRNACASEHLVNATMRNAEIVKLRSEARPRAAPAPLRRSYRRRAPLVVVRSAIDPQP